ncbi:MAG TPA: hypothetical protein VMU14_19590 [Acidimicrobiales bacterium]|nr:hypothetical protein [Acidimicrobiales bacterium]
MLGIHRHRSEISRGGGAPAVPTRRRATVSLSPGVHERLSGLEAALGAGADVVVGEPQRSTVLVVGAVGPAGAAFLRARYPSANLVVLDHHAADAAAAYLDAGADAYLAGAPLDEVAAHIRAVLRRPRATTVPLGADGEAAGRRAS